MYTLLDCVAGVQHTCRLRGSEAKHIGGVQSAKLVGNSHWLLDFGFSMASSPALNSPNHSVLQPSNSSLSLRDMWNYCTLSLLKPIQNFDSDRSLP